MNVRELIDALLEHNLEPDTDVMIESEDKEVATYRVSIGRSQRGHRILLIVPDEEMTTMEDAEKRFLVKEPEA